MTRNEVMQWYYSKGGAQQGPVSHAELQAKLAAGEVALTDLVWRDGMADWAAAGQVAELRVATVAGGVPPQMPSPYASPAPQYATRQQVPGGVIPNVMYILIFVVVGVANSR